MAAASVGTGTPAARPGGPGAQLILEDDEADDLQGGALVIWAGPDIKPGTRPRPRAFAGGGQCLPRCFSARRPRRWAALTMMAVFTALRAI